ncbi:MAG: prephenate dehydrogenase [Acholeplasmataceae bacterium]|jgi:prephenate dehydrogenase|nr:prephenate dehydrogenase [Acholeplasmataceae bacterium]
MKVFIVGLGLIGASIAEGLKQKGYHLFAYDLDEAVMEEAKKLKLIDETSSIESLGDAELIILALYPKDNVSFIQTYQSFLKPGQIITDVSGTKEVMMHDIEQILPEGISYTSMHPMAGKETSGFASRNAYLFAHANLIIVKGSKSQDKDEILLRNIADDLKFGKITVTDAKTHDLLIAFTSQLTHILAVCLMHVDQNPLTKEATGDSFRDLTRIAKINEVMWSELFLENKKALIDMIETFENELKHTKDLINLEDEEKLKTYLKAAKEKRKSFDIH